MELREGAAEPDTLPAAGKRALPGRRMVLSLRGRLVLAPGLCRRWLQCSRHCPGAVLQN